MFMTQNTKYFFKQMLALSLASIALGGGHATAATPEGAWKFEHSLDYYGRTPANAAPKFPAPVVHGQEISLSAACVAKFDSEDYAFADVFQPLSKEGVTEKQLDSFLAKNFGVALAKIKTVYSVTSSPANCARPLMEFFQVGDRLLIPVGVTFYSYVKVDAAKPAVSQEFSQGDKSTSIIATYKITPLPFDFDRYYASCRPKILGGKSLPQTTDKCGPNYFPYVADPKSDDPLMKLVGNHDYAKGGSEYASGFSPPFRQKTAATFLVFTPMQGVTLVRVDDFEVVRNEARDVMTGVYLSIVNGKVVDQISGCHFNRDYVCLDEGRPVAKLRANGSFEHIN